MAAPFVTLFVPILFFCSGACALIYQVLWFPDATRWAEGSVLIGSTRPLRLSRGDFEWKLAVPERARGFHDINLRNFEDLTNLYTAGPKELARYAGDGPLLTDDRPLAEYFLSLPRDRQPDRTGFKRDLSEIVVP